MSRRRLLEGAGAAAVLIAAALVVWSAAVTSTARVRASTGTLGLLTAGDISLTKVRPEARLVLEADGLFPGVTTANCMEVDYGGTLPSSVRLHGAIVGGTGLDGFTELTLAVGPGCDTGQPAPPLFDGTLADLAATHPDYGRGLVLDPQARPGQRLALWAEATIVDDDRAQGLTTEFQIVMEARP